MGNMSYCRFQNTSRDVSDCMEAVQYEEGVSSEERRAGVSMFRDFLDCCVDKGIIEDYGEGVLNKVFDRMAKADEEDYDD